MKLIVNPANPRGADLRGGAYPDGMDVPLNFVYEQACSSRTTYTNNDLGLRVARKKVLKTPEGEIK